MECIHLPPKLFFFLEILNLIGHPVSILCFYLLNLATLDLIQQASGWVLQALPTGPRLTRPAFLHTAAESLTLLQPVDSRLHLTNSLPSTILTFANYRPSSWNYLHYISTSKNPAHSSKPILIFFFMKFYLVPSINLHHRTYCILL